MQVRQLLLGGTAVAQCEGHAKWTREQRRHPLPMESQRMASHCPLSTVHTVLRLVMSPVTFSSSAQRLTEIDRESKP